MSGTVPTLPGTVRLKPYQGRCAPHDLPHRTGPKGAVPVSKSSAGVRPSRSIQGYSTTDNWLRC